MHKNIDNHRIGPRLAVSKSTETSHFWSK